MKIEIEQKPESTVFHFNMGVLESAEITDDNKLLINGFERNDWKDANNGYITTKNMVPQKQLLKNPFYIGDKQQPILTASKSMDGRIFLRLYKDENALTTYRREAEWVGSYWEGKVYEKANKTTEN